MLDRIVISGVKINDKDSNEIFRINRLSASFDIAPLFHGKIRINTVQMFGFNLKINKKNHDSELNIKYIIDAFKSNDKKKKKSNIDLRLNYLLLRNGNISYDILSVDTTPGKFNPCHVNISNITANISLKTFNKDSINAFVRRLSFKEHSGLNLNKMSLRLRSNKDRAIIDNFIISLPSSDLKIDSIWVEDKAGDLTTFSIKNPIYGLNISNAKLSVRDLSSFYIPLSDTNRNIYISVNADGNTSSLNIKKLKLYSGNDFDVDIVSHIDTIGVMTRINNIYIDKNIFSSIPLLKEKANEGILKIIDFVKMNGEIKGDFPNINFATNIQSSIGELNSNFKFRITKENLIENLSGEIKTSGLAIQEVLPKSNFGKVAFDLEIAANDINRGINNSLLYAKGNIKELEFKGYKYENIALDGGYENGIYGGKLNINDDNILLAIDGAFNIKSQKPHIDLCAKVANLDLYKTRIVLNDKYKDSRLSVDIDTDIDGMSIDDFMGNIKISNLNFSSNNGNYFNKLIEIGAYNISDREKKIYIESDFISASIRGNYSYKYLPKSIVNVLASYIPVLRKDQENNTITRKQIKRIEGNNFTFDIKISDLKIFNNLFMIPVELQHPADINGYFNDVFRRFRVDMFVPDITFKNKHFESSTLICETPTSDSLNIICRTNMYLKNENILTLSVNSSTKNNKVKTNIFWGNNQKETYGGNVNTITLLKRNDSGTIKTDIYVKKSNFILKDSLWTMKPSLVVVDSGKIKISKFKIEHKDQFLAVDGCVSPHMEDSIFVGLKKIDLGYIFELANIKKVVDFSGQVSGDAYANGVIKVPRINADLYVDNFSFNNSRLGDMNVKGVWNNMDKGIHINADVKDSDISHTTVNGVIYPIKPGSIDLEIATSHVDLGFLRHYMENIFSDINGRASGKIRIHGPFQSINLTGSAVAEDFRFKIDLLNTYIQTSDSVHFLPDKIFMNNILIKDGLGNSGHATVNLTHKHLKDLGFGVNARLNNMLVMNTKESNDMPFYGTVYASGALNITGGSGILNVNADMVTNPKTIFVYKTNTASSATNNQFVTFVDKTIYRRTDSLYIPNKKWGTSISNSNSNRTGDIRLNLNIEANPNAYIKLVMDQSAGDYIGGNGSGNIKVDFYNKGDVKMYGNYTINQGIYKFSLQEVIRKDFIIKSGSNITFNGNPLDAILDINAAYTVNSVSLQDLGSDIVNQVGQTNVKVNCTMNLSGALTNPTIKLGMELPNESEEVQRTVLNAISTEEQMNMQILYLLGIGKFYVQNYNSSEQNSNALSSVLSSTISGQLNNMFSNLINNNNWNIGTNFSTGVNGWTDVEFEGMLSGQMLNNRLLINGNFGYRDNALSQTNFIGDFEVEYLLNRSGNFRLKAYNKTNDRYYTKTTLTTQGLGFVFKNDFDNWKDLIGKYFRKRHGKTVLTRDTVNIE